MKCTFFICFYDKSETKKIIQLASFSSLCGKKVFGTLPKKNDPQNKMFTYNSQKALAIAMPGSDNSHKALTYNSQKA